jgi:hypothetical protein
MRAQYVVRGVVRSGNPPTVPVNGVMPSYVE